MALLNNLRTCYYFKRSYQSSKGRTKFNHEFSDSDINESQTAYTKKYSRLPTSLINCLLSISWRFSSHFTCLYSFKKFFIISLIILRDNKPNKYSVYLLNAKKNLLPVTWTDNQKRLLVFRFNFCKCPEYS